MIFALLSLFLGMAEAQTVVSGTVTSSEDGEPIIGASVVVKGTQVGAATDFDGNFRITTQVKNPQIVVSYIGMETVTLKGGQNMNIVLHPDKAQQIDEVVVTGIQKMDKRLFTGATTKVDAEKSKLDGVADVTRSLEGRAAGVSVQNVSSTFGTAPKIRVRGATSIYGSSSPLWVVDGVIMEDAVNVGSDDLSSGDAQTLIANAIAGLNADDIESFQVLKDGSATSIYGARAMAGVVVVTTKKGRAGRSSINYTGEFTYRRKPNYSEYNISNSQEQMGIY
jgi:TonB-dependent SusC/RagA subfamily outer membrane receptor